MNILEEIKQLIAQPLEEFQAKYYSAAQSDVPLIEDIHAYLNQSPGKQIRPVVALLSAGACGGIHPELTQFLVSMELLHSTSLIHDDVVDEASQRRGIATVNNKWGNKIAVLSGDFFLAQVMRMLFEADDKNVIRIFNKTVIEMSEGELLQQQSSMMINLSEENYLQTIYKKTATLIASCCEVGAYMASKGDEESMNTMRAFGKHLGLAFQMRDDILDYLPDSKTGKNHGNDIREHKMTLPLIGYLNICDENERESILDVLNKNALTEELADEIVKKVVDSDAISYSQQRLEEEIETAKQYLMKLPQSPYRDALEKFSDYMKTRNN